MVAIASIVCGILCLLSVLVGAIKSSPLVAEDGTDTKGGEGRALSSASDSCPPPGFHAAYNLNLTAWSINPLNTNFSWFVQQQMPIEYLPPDTFYCVAAKYTPLTPVSLMTQSPQYSAIS
jgi:hypothetical protein